MNIPESVIDQAPIREFLKQTLASYKVILTIFILCLTIAFIYPLTKDDIFAGSIKVYSLNEFEFAKYEEISKINPYFTFDSNVLVKLFINELRDLDELLIVLNKIKSKDITDYVNQEDYDLKLRKIANGLIILPPITTAEDQNNYKRNYANYWEIEFKTNEKSLIEESLSYILNESNESVRLSLINKFEEGLKDYLDKSLSDIEQQEVLMQNQVEFDRIRTSIAIKDTLSKIELLESKLQSIIDNYRESGFIEIKYFESKNKELKIIEKLEETYLKNLISKNPEDPNIYSSRIKLKNIIEHIMINNEKIIGKRNINLMSDSEIHEFIPEYKEVLFDINGLKEDLNQLERRNKTPVEEMLIHIPELKENLSYILRIKNDQIPETIKQEFNESDLLNSEKFRAANYDISKIMIINKDFSYLSVILISLIVAGIISFSYVLVRILIREFI